MDLLDKLKKRREALGSILAATDSGKIDSKPENNPDLPPPRKRTSTSSDSESKNDDLLSLLQAQSAKEKADQEYRDEILELLGVNHKPFGQRVKIGPNLFKNKSKIVSIWFMKFI